MIYIIPWIVLGLISTILFIISEINRKGMYLVNDIPFTFFIFIAGPIGIMGLLMDVIINSKKVIYRKKY